MRLLNFKTVLAACGSILVGAFAYAQEATDLSQDATLGKKITFSRAAGLASQVLTELGSKAGILLKTAPQTASEVLVLNIKEKTLAETMAKIAVVTAAQWKKEEEGYRLIRPESLVRKQAKAELDERTARLKASLNTQWAEVQKYPTLDAAAAGSVLNESRAPRIGGVTMRMVDGNGLMFNSMNSVNQPGTRAILGLLRSIDLSVLASMGPGARLVFATTPTAMQIPLGQSADTVIGKLLIEQRVFQEALTARGGSTEGITISGGYDPNNAPAASRPAKVLLVAQRMTGGDSISLQLTVYNDRSEPIASGFHMLGNMFTPIEQPNAKPIANEKPIVLSALAQELANAYVESGQGIATTRFAILIAGPSDLSISSDMANLEGKKAGKELRAYLLSPEKNDPLALAPGELVGGVASQVSESVVASLGDELLLPLFNLAKKPALPSSVLALTPYESKDGWLLIAPKKPYESRVNRIDRAALGKLVRALAAKRYLSLDDISAYSLRAPDSSMFGRLDFVYVDLIEPGTSQGELSRLNGFDLPIFRFFGVLSPAQRTALANGRSLIAGALSLEQQRLVRQIVFDSIDGPRRAGQGGPEMQGRRGQRIMPPTSDRESGRAQRVMPQMMAGPSLLDERTQLLPNGVPTGAQILARQQTNPAVYAIDQKSGQGRLMSAEQLGFLQGFAKNNGEKVGMTTPKADMFQAATQYNIGFVFELDRGVSMSRSLSDMSFDFNSQKISYENLPQNVRERIERAKRQGGEMRIGVLTGDDRGGKPPKP